MSLQVVKDLDRPSTFLDDNADDEDSSTASFIDDDDEDDDDDDNDYGDEPATKPSSRWQSLNPKIKQRLIEKGQAKAIANKAKREPKQDKKRRKESKSIDWVYASIAKSRSRFSPFFVLLLIILGLMMQVKTSQQEKKKASRIERPLAFDERTPLSAFFPGMEVTGLVISLTKYGAYVDVGTECDGLLHISQITRDFFVEHPRQVISPGDEITVTIRSTNPDMKKLHLTMLNMDDDQEDDDEDDEEERIALADIEPDDELWGQLKRVTDYGAYVEVGAEVDGFLHYMDHPSWEDGAHPSNFMKIGDRVRVWVSDLDLEQRRVKLTANRPTQLPGPRREINL
jgi:predicted RNA-binding protein with RPS1 domain